MRIGELCHTWRNYLAIGALGPDLFYLLPDYKDPVGSPLLHLVSWVLDTWESIDSTFLEPIEDWLGPTGANNSDLLNTLTGGLSNQLAAAMDEFSAALTTAIIGLLARLHDLFGLLTSGQSQGVSESAFYWSDMLHYRRTYDVPRVLYDDARAMGLAATTDEVRINAQTLQAFAVGWMSHCATDVTGHAFTNAKSGGPFRLHWQRHHLVENHFDAQAYRTGRGGQARYTTVGTSALHYRITFCERPAAAAPSRYVGRRDCPMFDYFGAFPSYPVGTTAADALARHRQFDTDTYAMPKHLTEAIKTTLRKVYKDTPPDITPEVLNTTDPAFGDDGRPNELSMAEMWEIAFRYLRHMGSSGFAVALPPPPGPFEEHPFPTPPGPGSSDPSQGTVIDDDDEFTILDLLLALIAFLEYVAQVITWLATLPLAALDPATFPVRTALYYGVVVPAHDLLIASRRILVMAGFLVPEPEEIDAGMTTLGQASTFARASLRADLADPAGFAASRPGSTEPAAAPRRPRSSTRIRRTPATPRATPLGSPTSSRPASPPRRTCRARGSRTPTASGSPRGATRTPTSPATRSAGRGTSRTSAPSCRASGPTRCSPAGTRTSPRRASTRRPSTRTPPRP